MNKPINHSSPPILLVPGAFCGGWVWEGNFMEFFRAAGFEVQALTFPSHIANGLSRQRLGLETAIRHLTAAISALPQPPILIAHSLGGLIALEAAKRVPVAATALLSPVPPDGVLRSMTMLGRRSPIGAIKMLMLAIDGRVNKYASAPIGIYSDTSDPASVAVFSKKLRGESLLALSQAIVRRHDPSQVRIPLHFYGAKGDYIIPASEVERVAKMHKAPFTIYPGMSHTFQQEREWRAVAKDIEKWLVSLRLNHSQYG
jgi:pimeloyl-ACP methyl ester carboxylesterase